MRILLALCLVIAACGDDTGTPTHHDGAAGVGGSGGSGGMSGDAGERNCLAACDRCPDGPCCGSQCCAHGEWCDLSSGTPTCRCGNAPGCTGGNMCAGPVLQQNGCGVVCCGANGSPCPL